MSVSGGRAIQKLSCLTASLSLLAAVIVAALPTHQAYAAQLTNRTLTLQAGVSDGGSKPGGVVNHQFTFTTGASVTNVGSIVFQYCTTASVATCVTPTGLSTTAATLSAQTGATGFTLNNSTNGAPYITRTAANIAASTALSFTLSTVTNPTATNTSFYVRISTYNATNGTGTALDNGSVTASTATQIVVTGTMPESIIFCTGATVSTTNSIPDCTTAGLGAITFNQLFSPTDTAIATSQMAASTNATNGYVITVNGPTLTSGSNTITALNTATTSSKGSSQFGMNLKLNTTAAASSFPSTSAEVAPAVATGYKGQAFTGYNTADTFKFTSGDAVAKSDNGGAGPTNSQIYTVSYIANVNGAQPAGTYVSTLTYICTATF